MAYHVYTTEGIVFSGDLQGEADKYYSLFTKELGLIFAIGKGIRKQQSKLSPQMDVMTHGEFSFVHGKRGWRIIGARETDNVWKAFRDDKVKQRAVVDIVRTLRTLIAGEDPHPELFGSFVSAVAYLQTENLSHEEVKVWKRVATLRLLALLGYGDKPAYESFLHTSVWSRFVIADALLLTDQMNADIEEALIASDLAHKENTAI